MAEKYYDSDRGLAEYLLFHYGGYEHRLPPAITDGLNFPVRCVTECLDAQRLHHGARALDLGCAVGRSSFELARHCVEVVGIDFSANFVKVATHLKNEGSYSFAYVDEGHLTHGHCALVPHGIDRSRVKFEQGNAVHLRKDLGQFDVVLMANLIDRVQHPGQCLEQMPVFIKQGGQLIIASPYTWLAEYTPREQWLGGYMRDGRPVRTFEGLEKVLTPNFKLLRRQELPFIIREHARKFQLGFSEATTWVRT